MPAKVKVDKLNRKHPYWKAHESTWTAYDLLFRGGMAIQAEAGRFLTKRPKELSEVYLARLQRFNYLNYLGPGIGYYLKALFHKNPDVDILLKGSTDDQQLPAARKEPYSRFLMNCDRAGTTFHDLAKCWLRTMAIYKGVYICVDLPAQSEGDDFRSYAEQKQAGALDPYLAVYDPRSVINWDVDGYGNLNWAVIHTEMVQDQFLEDSVTLERWYYYDRKTYRIYERRKVEQKADFGNVQLFGPDGQTVTAFGEQEAELVGEGSHAMAQANAGAGQVPIRYFELPDDLHLMDLAFLPAVSHINLQNSYEWALFMANLPIPIIKTDAEFTQAVSESAYVQLGPEDSFEWTEPKGTSYDHSQKCLDQLREEIYRLLLLQAQGRSSSATAASSSGYSKEMDIMPSKEVLQAFGGFVKAGEQILLGDVALVRGDDDIEFDVRGLNFGVDSALQEAETAEILDALEIQSDTLDKEKQKRVAMAYLTDANRSLQQKVIQEIESAPTKSQIEQQQQEQAQALQNANQLNFARTLQRSVKSTTENAEAAAA